ncbi:uncharacterized protein ASCRUDRAFT_37525, partial [Ascoidea rubescens DSM 1968]
KTCPVCRRVFVRDLKRHIRIHDDKPRFKCVFHRKDKTNGLKMCLHSTGRFNRPYDHKKHLLNNHFTFEDPHGKKEANLGPKLDCRGSCNYCGKHMTGQEFIEHVDHQNNQKNLCPYLTKLLSKD